MTSKNETLEKRQAYAKIICESLDDSLNATLIKSGDGVHVNSDTTSGFIMLRVDSTPHIVKLCIENMTTIYMTVGRDGCLIQDVVKQVEAQCL